MFDLMVSHVEPFTNTRIHVSGNKMQEISYREPPLRQGILNEGSHQGRF